MKCHVCKESTLVMTERQGIEIDDCRNTAAFGSIAASLTRSSSETTSRRRPAHHSK